MKWLGGGCDDQHPAPPSPNILHRPQDPTGPNLFWRSNRSHSFFKIQQVPLFFEDPRSHPFSKSKVALFFEDPRSHSFSNPYFPIRLSLYWLLWDFHNVTLQYNKAMNICVHFCQTLVPLENLGKFVSNIVSSVSLFQNLYNNVKAVSIQYPINTHLNVQLDADILNGGNTEEQIRETFFEVKTKQTILIIFLLFYHILIILYYIFHTWGGQNKLPPILIIFSIFLTVLLFLWGKQNKLALILIIFYFDRVLILVLFLQVYKLFDDFGIIDKNKYLNINNEIKV